VTEHEASGTQDVGSNVSYSFGSFELLPDRLLLELHGEPVPIGSRAFNLLLALVARAGEVVSFQELLDLVWPSQIVHEANLRVQMGALRKILAQGLEGAQPVKTVPLQGYAFVAPVVRLSHEAVTKPTIVQSGGGNLPLPLTPVLGRGQVIDHLISSVTENRLVSIVGPGGIGKTTVALAVGRKCVPVMPDGVHFVELSSVADPKSVPSRLATVLGIAVLSDNPLAGLIAHLRGKRMLILIDTCEHVVAAVATLCEALLASTEGVVILATSRESLRAAGEWVHRLSSLPFPPEYQRLTVEGALSFAAVDLFVQRAKATASQFQLRPEDIPAVSQICRRLDGIPLALEFAAGRIDEIGLKAVADSLDNRFTILSRGRRTALARHQTLIATMDWSHDLLPADEQVVLRQLSVFPGKFSVEATASIAELTPDAARIALSSLFDKSLVVADFTDDVVQYRLLDTIRAYAAMKLVSSGEAEVIRWRHARCVSAVLQEAEKEWDLQDSTVWKRRYAHLVDDVRVALDWGMSPTGDRELAIRLTAVSSPLWFALSLLGEFGRRIETALAAAEHVSVETAVEIRLWDALGHSIWHSQGNMPAMAASFSKALEGARRLKLRDAELRALWGLLVYANTEGNYAEAVETLDCFGQVAAELGDPKAALTHRRMSALALHYAGDHAAAREHAEYVLRHPSSHSGRARQKGLQFDQRVTASTMRARTLWMLGFPDQAWRCALEAVELAHAVDHALSVCFVLANAAAPIAFWRGDRLAAVQMTERLLATSAEHSFVTWHTFGQCYDAILKQPSDGCLVSVFQSAVGWHLLETVATIDEALASDAVLERADREAGGWSTPELLRIRAGRLLRRDPGATEAAEAALRQALAIARRQSAVAWELRSATALAEMWRGAGQEAAAALLLAPVYRKFVEGVTTKDVIRAREILRSLVPQRDKTFVVGDIEQD
jgi:predicted ATPase/DNA-binding winged helix-turn-helix (wHTH) protein